MLSVENLEPGYGPMQVLWQPSLGVQAGTITSLLGPNGAGKTTAMRIIATLDYPNRGLIKVSGW